MAIKPYTLQEVELIHEYYIVNKKNKVGWLDELSKRIDRPKTNISRYARQKGLTDRKRGVDMVERMCEYCGNVFKQKPYETNHTCSKKCGDALGSKKREGGHLWEFREHPRGMKGRHHTEEFSKRMSDDMRLRWKDKNSVYNSEEMRQKKSDNAQKIAKLSYKNHPERMYSRSANAGWLEVGGKKHYFRSKWEKNIATYFQFLKDRKAIKEWEYEPETFWFEKIKRGVRSYLPDFRITNIDGSTYFVEVKGWMDDKSRTKIKRMGLYFPEIKLEIYDEKVYKNLKSQVGRILNWE